MPERPKGAVCKIAGDAYGGSNPPPPTHSGVFSKLGPLTSQNYAEEARAIVASRTPVAGQRSSAISPSAGGAPRGSPSSGPGAGDQARRGPRGGGARAGDRRPTRGGVGVMTLFAAAPSASQSRRRPRSEQPSLPDQPRPSQRMPS